MLLPFVDFNALTPEENSLRILPTQGSGPLLAAAMAYSDVAEALTAAGGAADGSKAAMIAAWPSPSSDTAQRALGDIADWPKQQSTVATRVANVSADLAVAYMEALSAMPPYPVVAGNRVAAVGLTLTNGMGQNTAAIAANEAAYYQMWVQAQAVMYRYAGRAISALSALPPQTPTPPPIAGGAGDTATAGTISSALGGPGAGGMPSGAPSAPGAPGGGGAPIPDPGGSSADPFGSGAPGTDLPTEMSSTANPVDQLPADPMAANGTELSGTADGYGFQGTSPTSPTLAGLNGGMGSMVTLGMFRDGAGGIATAATRFRIPANWVAGPGSAFGATPSSAATGAPIGRGAAPKGASAPVERMLRRRRDDSDKPAKVFTPGTSSEVPTLAQPPAIGVIEYDGTEPDDAPDSGWIGHGVIEGDPGDPGLV
ncbi:PPE family protein [Nocardia colli]|uniref:PPE family protein n=1 Tax=Nocardia colli TaxID=2545717 RepID=A0A5N0DYY0_9NOCA|nr:PPE domain-containing protein [Nocardia colli]KAA8881913.1 PPE family protein [Nocardia colli]